MTNVEMEMKLDLLVDDELSDAQRAELLRGMSQAEWKELSLRFLQRQVERKGVRQLIDAGSVYPEDRIPQALPFRKKEETRGGRRWAMGIAAGLVIAIGSAAITAWSLREHGGMPIAKGPAVDMVPVVLPGAVTGDTVGQDVKVSVTGQTSGISAAMFLPVGEPGTKQSLVIIKHGEDQAIAVPVSTTNVKWN